VHRLRQHQARRLHGNLERRLSAGHRPKADGLLSTQSQPFIKSPGPFLVAATLLGYGIAGNCTTSCPVKPPGRSSSSAWSQTCH
jgi:hypothetical protein